MIRAVFDVNVLVSALLSPHGTCADLLDLWGQGHFDLIVSRRLLDELAVTLKRPRLSRHLDPHVAGDLLELLLGDAVTVEDRRSSSRTSRDPHDDYLLGLLDQADLLVTGDADLLVIGDGRIVNPRAFLTAVTG